MQKWLIGIAVFVVVVAGITLLRGAVDAKTTYESPELGFAFTYPKGEGGYELTEQSYPTDARVRRVIVLTDNEEANNIPIGGEGPPTITILVLANTEKEQPRVWAERHIQYSNINLSQSDIEEVVLGGANAIRYRADGLYASDIVIAAHGENMYVFTGMYLDADSKIRKDFSDLLSSVRFIPSPGQQ